MKRAAAVDPRDKFKPAGRVAASPLPARRACLLIFAKVSNDLAPFAPPRRHGEFPGLCSLPLPFRHLGKRLELRKFPFALEGKIGNPSMYPCVKTHENAKPLFLSKIEKLGSCITWV
jgi:hypothetical protein